ncbi:hypothetical protein H0H87_010687 [Tephrocybe sp. NHM501043]|nr:hypothetical protein H0H87_010687 [Tephrocybe sp. NHM501043]
MFSPFSNLHSSYYDAYDPYQAQRALQYRRALARQHALEAERARRAQMYQGSPYLPDEPDDLVDEEDWAFRDALQRRQAYEQRMEEKRIREEHARLELLAKEEEQRREKLKQEQRSRQAQNRHYRPSHSPPRSRSPHEIHIPTNSPPTTSVSERSPLLPAEQAQPRYTLEEQHEAASKLQKAWRAHIALSNLRKLEKEFDDLRKSFKLPTVVDFQDPNQGIISVTVPDDLPDNTADDVPKLAYNQTNYSLHSYVEALNRFLIRLDGVESRGDANVRNSRRCIVGRVEKEANSIEMFGKKVWATHSVNTVPDGQSSSDSDS